MIKNSHMESDESKASFDIFLCYSKSKTDQEFANNMIKEWGSKFIVKTTMDPPLTTGKSISNFLDPFKGKFFFITIISTEFFSSTAKNWFDDYLQHKLSENRTEALNSFPDVVVIPILRISEDKAATTYPCFKELNSVNSCIGASSVAQLITLAHQHIQDPNCKESWENKQNNFYRQRVVEALGDRKQFDVFVIYLEDNNNLSEWMKDCIRLLEGKEFNLNICHRKTRLHSCSKTDFVIKSTKSSSKILIFISKKFYERKRIWKTRYEPWMEILERKKDIICIICKDGQTSCIPSILRDCECIFENDDQYKEKLYEKLISESGTVCRNV